MPNSLCVYKTEMNEIGFLQSISIEKHLPKFVSEPCETFPFAGFVFFNKKNLKQKCQ